MADFYAEDPQADPAAVRSVVREYVAQTTNAVVQEFELWTSPQARVHSLLQEAGFARLDRELLACTARLPDPPAPPGLRICPVAAQSGSATLRFQLAGLLHASYSNTVDGSFFHSFSTVEGCTEYVQGITGSAFFDEANSWLAISEAENRLTGCALTSICPHARSFYLEQLVVHPRASGRGLGRHLLARVASRIGNSGIQQVVFTVTTSNESARRLYVSCGARVLEKEAAYVRRSPGT